MRTRTKEEEEKEEDGESVIIRPAVVGDAAELARLSGQLGYPVASEVLAERVGRTLVRSDQLVMVAHVNGKLCGWLQAHSAEIIESGFRVEIVGLIVDESVRRRGVGRRLVREAENWATSLGAQAVVVRTNIVRAESQMFYSALGYRQTKTQNVYRKVLGQQDNGRN
jgi:GNAT superfamily N-acetyltransferase